MRYSMFCLLFLGVGCSNIINDGTTAQRDNNLSAVYPRDIWIDDGFEEYEEESIINVMDMWEMETKTDLFRYKGRIAVGEFSIGNLYDGKSIIYKIRGLIKRGSPSTVCKNNLGFCWDEGDILFCQNNFIRLEKEWDLSQDELLLHVKQLVTHELGHFLGLNHDEDIFSIMCISESCVNQENGGFQRKIQSSHVKQVLRNMNIR